MSRPRATPLLVTALLVLGCWAAVGAVGSTGTAAGKSKPPTVKVADDYFSPSSLKIKKKTKVNFKWDKSNINSHDVALEKGPNGVKKKDFESGAATIGYRFSPTFNKPGTYDLLCTIHPDVMQITVKVKK